MTDHSTTPTPAEPRHGWRLLICVLAGAAMWMLPPPEGLSPQAWHVFAVFVATILSFLFRPLPMGACVLIGLVVLAGSGELAVPASDTAAVDPLNRISNSLKVALKGFANTTVWLVVAAFLISGAMVHSGLGRRVALIMLALLGRTTLGLGYAIAAAELLLAPFIPSNTARGGGLMMPIVNSICGVLGSDPHHRPRRVGEYLVLCGAHLNLVTAAMFLTGMAANPLVSKAAKDLLDIEFGWGRWILGSMVPGVASLLLVPLVLYWLVPPQLTDARDAQQSVQSELRAMGPWTTPQYTMTAVLLTMLLLWATVPLQVELLELKIPSPLVAVGGVVALVVLGVLPYHQVTGNAPAWDALLWLGGLVSMADALKTTQFVDWFADQVQAHLGSTTGIAAAVLLAIVYFYSMYVFSMLTGHILAFAGVFFAVAAAVGAPPLVMVALVAYFSNLCGCTTNYSTGPVVIYFGLGLVPPGRWFWVGFVMSLVHLAVWLGLGLAWWKLLGWW